MSPARPLVVLIGPPGAGKSSIGPLVAARLGVEFTDTDAEVGAVAGKPVADIFIENGEEAFRALERTAVAGALTENGTLREHGGVLALGSGAVLDEAVQHLLNGLPVVYLSAELQHGRPADRPGPAPGRGPGQPARPPARHAGRARRRFTGDSPRSRCQPTTWTSTRSPTRSPGG